MDWLLIFRVSVFISFVLTLWLKPTDEDPSLWNAFLLLFGLFMIWLLMG